MNIQSPSGPVVRGGFLLFPARCHASMLPAAPRGVRGAPSALPPREDGTDDTYRAKAVLAGLGFSEGDFSRDPAVLSGGFQVRLNLARTLLSPPDLPLLDDRTHY